MHVGISVAVAGASGYAGGELLRLLSAHPEVELGPLTAGAASVGLAVRSVHPHLVSLGDRTFSATEPATLGTADVVFLALPHGRSAALADTLADSVRVIDLGADRRLRDAAAWARYYPGHAHASPWLYGLPELAGVRTELAGARRVAMPGCHASAVILGLAPLLAADLVSGEDIVSVSASGTSGAGASASRRLLGSEVMGDVSAYRVGAHQHTPEIAQALGVATLSFTPLLVPMARGILATSSARLRPGVGETDLRRALAAAYADEPFVHLLEPGDPPAWPHTAGTLGSNSAHLQVTADADAGRAVVCTAIDNLGKGAAGQAVQVLNLLLGLPEVTGLATDGVAP